MGVLERVREQWPELAFLLNDREVGPLLRQAVDPNQGFSPQRFRTELTRTSWYKNRSVSQRQYEISRHTDPGEFRSKVADYQHSVRMEAKRLGVSLTNNEVVWLAHAALRNGYSTSDPRIGLSVSRVRHRNPSRTRYGAIRAAARSIRGLAKDEYFVPMNNNQMWKWADNIARGFRTEDDFRTWASNQAEKRYPHLRAQLRAGNTMQDLFGGHIQAIADTLELSPGEIQPGDSNSKWRAITGITDKKTGRTRAATVSEAEALARSDSRFWQTKAGREADAGMSQFLVNLFGKRA